MLTADLDRLGVVPGARLLDLGAGGGRHAFEAARRGAAVVALDRDAAELKDVSAVAVAMLDSGEIEAPSWAGSVNGDALDLPFGDEAFDLVVAAEVLEHVWDDERALAEIVRVLRPGGRLAVTVPSYWPERVCWALSPAYHDRVGGHVRIYRLHELERRLERAGLYLRGSHRAHAFHAPYWWLRCRAGLDDADASWAVRRYHRLLCAQIERNPRWAARLERALDPVLGKSVVVYAEKVPTAETRHRRPARA
jgi:SAM-dependent methyltransferase